MASLCNLVTLDVSQNGLERLEGVKGLAKLKRLVANSNKLGILEPLRGLKLLVEIDLENNPVADWYQVLSAVTDKKDILVLNLKSAPVM